MISFYNFTNYIYITFFPTDDLPIRGFIGHLEEVSILPHNHRTYLWTHLHFTFEYNGDQVGTNWATSFSIVQCCGITIFGYYACIMRDFTCICAFPLVITESNDRIDSTKELIIIITIECILLERTLPLV